MEVLYIVGAFQEHLNKGPVRRTFCGKGGEAYGLRKGTGYKECRLKIDKEKKDKGRKKV